MAWALFISTGVASNLELIWKHVAIVLDLLIVVLAVWKLAPWSREEGISSLLLRDGIVSDPCVYLKAGAYRIILQNQDLLRFRSPWKPNFNSFRGAST